jgi:hypothetical protein
MAERKFDTRMVEQKVAGGVAKVKQMMREAEGECQGRHERAASPSSHIESHPEAEEV